MISVQPILNHCLSMSLVPGQSLLKVLDNVASKQWRVMDRLTSAILFVEVSADYESKLLRDVIVVEQRLFMRIAIQLAAKGSAFTVFRAIAVLIPKPKNDMAINR